jgi:MFS family permease
MLGASGTRPGLAGPAPRPVWALAGIVPAAWLAVFAGTLATGRTLQTIDMDLHLSSGQGLTRVVLPYLIAAVLLLPAGYLLGRRTPNAVALPAVALLVVSLAVTAFTPNASVLTVARVLAGLGAGALVGTAAALTVGVAPAVRTPVGVVAGAGVALAAGLGVVVGGLLTEYLGFRTGFLLALVLGLIVGLTIAVVAAVGPAQRPHRQPIAPGHPTAARRH